MCGIAGLLSPRPDPIQAREGWVRAMTDAIEHRGPDGQGVASWGPVTLGHRRLSILDLSPAGRQPMTSSDGRWSLTYNGEIYNFQAIRAELASRGRRFAGGSDTEVLLEAIAEWGPAEALRRANGMFALAAWDHEAERLYLARDRVGKKPLYWGRVDGRLVFASELKALRRAPGFTASVDRTALARYLRYNAVPGTECIYEGLHKVEPGGLRCFERDGGGGALTRFWSAAEAAARGLSEPFAGTAEEAVDEVERVLLDATKLRMISDVPLGAFLSGGIDSSLVVALMQAQSSRPVRTFSIGFHVEGYNEAQHAKRVAAHLGTEHTELYVTPKETLDVVPRLAAIWDEPFCDSSQIPTLLVAQMARRHVTVCLSGDGGDELFSGYSRYPFVDRLWRLMGRVPSPARSALATTLGLPPVRRAAMLAAAGVRRFEPRLTPDRVRLLGELLALDDPRRFYRYLLSVWRTDRPVVRGAPHEAIPPLVGEPTPSPPYPSMIGLASYIDLIAYLPDDILVKVDRATMAVSLEARAPLLDFRTVELALSLPGHIKRRGGELKWPLKALVHRYVPRSIMERPKMGFGVPVAEWLRGPLAEWAGDLLSPARLRREGYFDPAPIEERWASHRAGRANHGPELWAVLMFQAWLDETRGAAAGVGRGPAGEPITVH